MNAAEQTTSDILGGKRVAFVGKLAAMPRREAARLVRQHGGTAVDSPDVSTHVIVLGEEELPLGDPDGLFQPDIRQAAEQGKLEILTETQFLQRIGLVDQQQEIHRLYTPAMLADLLHLPIAVVRRWHRRGLIVPVREVRKLPYFDFQEVATARRLAELLASGMKPAVIEKKLAALARCVPGAQRPIAQLTVMVEGREILLRQGDGLIELGGQLRFDFEAAEAEAAKARETLGPQKVREAAALSLAGPQAEAAHAVSADELIAIGAELEEEGNLLAAVEMYRAAMSAGGPTAERCFQVAELLYRMGDLAGARERFYMAIELDEDYVEARANLGCVLAETGQLDLAVAAFEGALVYHPDYADPHYHLARTLDELGRRDEAERHWRAFLELAPNSPWADQARTRLGE